MRMLLKSSCAVVALSCGGIASAQTAADPVGAEGAQSPAEEQTDALDTPTDANTTEVVVTGIRRSIQNSTATKRRAVQVVDAISSEDIGKLPDATVADALQRVPGVQISRNFGQGNRVVIRGLQSVRLEVDGRASVGHFMESSNGFQDAVGRNFGLESLSSVLFSGIEVYKSPTAQQIEGGLGGVINSRTNKPFDFKKPTVVLSAEANTGSKLGKIGYTGAGFVTSRFMDNRLGVLIGGAYTKEPVYLTGLARGGFNESGPLIDQNGDGLRDIRPTAVRTERFNQVDRKRIGVTGNVQLQLTDDMLLYADTTWSRLVVARELFRGIFNIGTGAAITNPQFDGNYVFAGTVSSPFQSETNFRYERQITRNSAVGARYQTGPLLLSAEFSRSYGDWLSRDDTSAIRTNAPVTLNFEFAGRFPSVTLSDADRSLIAAPASYGAIGGAGGGRGQQTITTEEDAARIDSKYSFGGSLLDSIEVGARFSKLTNGRRRQQANFGVFNPNNVGALVNVGVAGVITGQVAGSSVFGPERNFQYPGFPDTFVVTDHDLVRARDAALFGPSPLLSDPGSFYDLREDSYAGYGQVNLKSEFGGLPFRANVGVRVIKTDVDTTANAFSTANGALTISRANFQNSYTDVLPSANIAFDVTDSLIFRLAASKTMARQAFAQEGLAPILVVSVNTVDPSLSTAQSGNPFLEPTRVRNFDTTVEYYFTRSGYLSGNLFYKKAEGFPVRVTRTQVVPGVESLGPIAFTVPVNSDPATIKGLELSYQHTFDFLPGWASGFGALAAFTYVDASTDLTFPNGTAGTITLDDAPLTGVSKYAYNLTGFYERGGFNLRLSYVWRDKRLFAIQSQGNGPGGSFDATNTGPRFQYVGANGSMDASASYDITPQFNVFFNANNLLPKKSAPPYYTERERFVFRQDIGERRYTAGVRARF